MERIIRAHNEISPTDWDAFVMQAEEGGLYHLHGFISALIPHWEALVITVDGEWQAVVPFVVTRRWGITNVAQPTFAQYWGICFRNRAFNHLYQQLSWKRRIVLAIADYFQKYDLFTQNFSPCFNYPIPFHWHGYQIHTRYTYQLGLEQEEAQLYEGLAAPLRRQIQKAQRNNLNIMEERSPASLLSLIRANEMKGNLILGKNMTNYQRLKKLSNWLVEEERGRLFIALDEAGQSQAAGLYGYFRGQCIYLAGAVLPEARSSGAMSFLMWEAIRRAKASGSEIFDFEGSMLKGVESFFRKFGAQPVPYLQIHKNQLPLLIRWMLELRS